MAELSREAILERYRTKKTSEGRRECIRQLAVEYKCAPYVIAEILRDEGCVVDGRLIRKIKPDLGEPGWVPYTKRGKAEPPPEPEPEEILPAAEPEPEPAPPEEDSGMTVGALQNLLEGFDPEIPVILAGGTKILGAVLSAAFDARGERIKCAISLIS